MKRFVSSLIVGGLALTLAACGTPADTLLPNPGNAVVVTANPSSGNTSLPAAQTGTQVMGQITAISGQTLTVQDNRQQSSLTVNLTADSQIFKQASVALADIPVGATITALGSQTDSTFTAQQIHVGTDTNFGFGGQSPSGQNPNGQGGPQGQNGNPPSGQQGGPGNGGQPPAGGAQGDPNGAGGPGQPNNLQRLTGTVEQASATSLTVKVSDGTTVQVTLALNGQATQQVAASLSDLVVGSQITASGTENGSTLTATRIQLMPAMQAS